MDVSINRTADFRELTISYGAGTPTGETIIGGIARADILNRDTAHQWLAWHTSYGEWSSTPYASSDEAIAATRAWFSLRTICRDCREDHASVTLCAGRCVPCRIKSGMVTRDDFTADDPYAQRTGRRQTVTDAITGAYADALEYGEDLTF